MTHAKFVLVSLFKHFVSVNMSLIALVVFVSLLRFFCAGNMNHCPSFKMKSENINRQLDGHKMAEVSGSGHSECAKLCMSLSVCKSIDFYVPKKVCKLNDVNSSSVDKTEFKNLSGAVFTDISEWPSTMVGGCSSRPCPVYQRCIHNMMNYFCVNITCSSIPSIRNGTIKLRGPDKNKFLDTARVQCNKMYRTFVPTVKCQASGTWTSSGCVSAYTDCKGILKSYPDSLSGVYPLYLFYATGGAIWVYCDMVTDGGGWTVIQKRFDGSTNFYRRFRDYKYGFGSKTGEHWLGLWYIQTISKKKHTALRVEMTKADGTTAYEQFQDFSLTGPEYTLNFGTQTGTPGLASEYMSYNRGFNFSTYDSATANCAVDKHGAWWYNNCTYVNLNGRYCTPGTLCSEDHGVHSSLSHVGFAGFYSLKKSTMMIRQAEP